MSKKFQVQILDRKVFYNKDSKSKQSAQQVIAAEKTAGTMPSLALKRVDKSIALKDGWPVASYPVTRN